MSKMSCDLLISAARVLPSSTATPLKNAAIAISGSHIVAIGSRAELLEQYAPTLQTELPNHALMPGLVNTHCHAAMTLLKGLGEGLSLMPWLQEVIWPAEAALVNAEFVSLGTDLALLEMISRGVTTFSDMYFFPATCASRASTAGVRCQIAGPVIDAPNAWSKDGDDSLRQVLALFDEWRPDPLISVAFGPHSAYALSWPLLEKVQMYADELDAPVHIHLHENSEEVAAAKAERGSGWISALDTLGMLNPRLQAVHLTTLDSAEIALLGERGVHALHCPHSNLKLGSGIAPVAQLQKAGVNVALGTDGALSNNTLDILSEARLASLLARSIDHDATALGASQALAMATENGARALGLANLGTLAPGQHADLAAFDLDSPPLLPLRDLGSQLLHGGGGLRASDVWVGGERLLANGEHLTLDAADIITRVGRWQDTIAQ